MSDLLLAAMLSATIAATRSLKVMGSLPSLRFPTIGVVLTGIFLGAAYTLSPITAWAGLAIWMIFVWAGRGTTGRERLWLSGVLGTAVAIRMLGLVALFLLPHDSNRAVSVLFPDESFILQRSLWLRNIALDIPIAWTDYPHLRNAYGESSFLYLLAYVQILLGPAPYGVRLLNMCLYLVGALALYRVARSAYGRLPALGGLAAILFLPSLTLWSISALKEPMYVALAAVSVAAAVRAGHAERWVARWVAVGVCLLAALAAEDVRQAGQLVIGGGVLAGAAVAVCLRHRLLLLAAAILCAVTVGYSMRSAPVQNRIQGLIREGAARHIGYARTPGWNYKLLDPQFYRPADPAAIAYDYVAFANRMTPPDMARFVIRSAISFVLVPLPWSAASPSSVAFLPQHIIWYVLVILALVGIPVGLRANPLLTSILVCTIVLGATAVALSSGNVGTLVRHRDTAVMPLIVWLSSLGFCSLLQQTARRSAAGQRTTTEQGAAVSPSSTIAAASSNHVTMTRWIESSVTGRLLRQSAHGSATVAFLKRVARTRRRPGRTLNRIDPVGSSIVVTRLAPHIDDERVALVAGHSRLLRSIERFFLKVQNAWRAAMTNGLVGRLWTPVSRLDAAERVRLAGWIAFSAATTRALLGWAGTSIPSDPGLGWLVVLLVALVCIGSAEAVVAGFTTSRYRDWIGA